MTPQLLQQRQIVAQRRTDAVNGLARLSALRVERGVSPEIERDRLVAEGQSAAAAVAVFAAAIEEQYARLDLLAGRTIGFARRGISMPTGLPHSRSIDLSATPKICSADARILSSQKPFLPRAMPDLLPLCAISCLALILPGSSVSLQRLSTPC